MKKYSKSYDIKNNLQINCLFYMSYQYCYYICKTKVYNDIYILIIKRSLKDWQIHFSYKDDDKSHRIFTI